MERNMASSQSGSISSVPNGRIVDFETAELRKVPFQDSLYLWVRGKVPEAGFEIQLAPRVYHGQPDYWGIEVAIVKKPDADNDIGANDTGNNPSGEQALFFERSVPLSGITGNRGITVIGANQMKRIEITSESL
jgi:hypothetical protein